MRFDRATCSASWNSVSVLGESVLTGEPVSGDLEPVAAGSESFPISKDSL